ncbi:hypothetical protein [Halomonas sp. SL1]|uniref:hypothetical protein n=1 Tax=Halomonas sp. SL1 TaxID=2137478 RepID=UPI0011B9459D|nr:hypothetical protein [Halomonas sp. SL1]
MTEPKKRGRPKNHQYQKIKDIPPHLFKNRQMNEPCGQEFKDYLKYMLENHPDDLHYIFKASQEYVNYNGSFRMTFEQWKSRLANKLNKKDE